MKLKYLFGLIVVPSLILLLVVPASAQSPLYEAGLKANEIKNSEAKNIMKLRLEEKDKDIHFLDLSENSVTLEMLEGISSDEKNLVEVYSFEDNSLSDKIVQDMTTGTYILLEIDHKEQTSTITFNHDTLEIKEDIDKSIYLQKDNGEKIFIYEEFLDEDLSLYFDKIPDDNRVTPAAASWVAKRGPFHKTTKVAFTVLEIIANIASGFTLTVTGPIGAVLFLSSVAVSIGSTIKPTLHIKYYIERRSDCSTYHRETRYYYGAYSELSNTFYEKIRNKNGTPKYDYYTFHSSNPEYAGGACSGYN